MIKECGFNSFGSLTDRNIIANVVPKAIASGLKYIPSISDDDVPEENLRPTVGNYVNSEGVGGWVVGDEPNIGDNSESRTDIVIRFLNFIRSLNPSQMSYTNFGCPTNDSLDNLEDNKFSNSLLSFYDRCKLPVWTYDYYPIRTDDNASPAKAKLKYDFYAYLEIIKRISKQTSRPFWSYCATINLEYLNGNGESRNPAEFIPEPTLGHLRVEAFSALAYGAQGLVFWRYSPKPDTLSERCIKAMVNKDGTKTSIWYTVKELLSEIKRYTHVFLDSEVISCQHTGGGVPGNLPRLKLPFGPLSSLTGGSEGVLVSHLVKDNRNYLVIVNHSPIATQDISLKFSDGNYIIREETPSSSSGVVGPILPDPDASKKITLEAGGYVIYSWTTKF